MDEILCNCWALSSHQLSHKMGSSSSINVTLVCCILAALLFPSYGILDEAPQEDTTTVRVTLGEDVYFPCSAPANPLIYVWQKNDRNVEADQAFTQNRLYILLGQGMLILNVEEQDRGLFICTVFDETLVVLRYRLDVIPRIEDVGDSEDAFQCGYPRQRSRIVGGRKVNHPGAYPWMALLWHKVQRRPFCGCTVLSRRFVVTGATCFLQSGYDPNDVEVRLGEYNITSTESYEVTMQIAEMIPHSNYDQPTYDSDILLLKLQQPIVYSDYIIPICLPSERRGERYLQAGTRGYVIGWGRTEYSANPSDYSDILRRANLSITDQEQCGSQHTHVVTNNMFCAVGESSEEDACSGDSGGPFIVEDDDRNYLVGIVSWGIGCADINFPGVYTRVNRFTKWILEIIRSDLEPCRETFRIEEDVNQEQNQIQSLEDQVNNLKTQLKICQNRVSVGTYNILENESTNVATTTSSQSSRTVYSCVGDLNYAGTSREESWDFQLSQPSPTRDASSG